MVKPGTSKQTASNQTLWCLPCGFEVTKKNFRNHMKRYHSNVVSTGWCCLPDCHRAEKGKKASMTKDFEVAYSALLEHTGISSDEQHPTHEIHCPFI